MMSIKCSYQCSAFSNITDPMNNVARTSSLKLLARLNDYVIFEQEHNFSSVINPSLRA